MGSIQTYRDAQMEPNGSTSGYRNMQAEPNEDNEEKEAIGLEDSDSEDDAEAGSSVNMFQSRMRFHDALAVAFGNRTISDDNAEELLRGLTTDADKDVIITFREGKRDKFDESALSVDIALFYVPGADLVEVNILENREISREAASQKTAMWRVLTAGNMLRELEVQRDLKIIRYDKTASVIAKHRANRGLNPGQLVTNAFQNAMTRTEEKDKVVNIDSKKVKILNTFSEPKVYDLVCTCIEIDGKSLLDLIFNFRNLCSAQGKFAKLPTEETVKILETMIEDARRLLVRSPILTRVAQRIRIQTSQNTRYGFDTGTMFHTFTTSKGIAEVIQQGVGYYSSLQVSKEAQEKIRSKFMQMVVFLLSLLNDEDLKNLRPALEQSYDLKADRKSIEMTILKVLTYFAVGSNLFLNGVISAFQMAPILIKDDEKSESIAWDHFLGEAARLGWLLPGTPEDLGRKTGSWKVKWKKFKDSDVFDHLQYCGARDTINYIPPLKVHSEEYDNQEVSAEFRNGETYFVAAKDLDNITLAIRNRYTVTHVGTKLQRELVVKEEVLFKELDKAATDLDHICNTVNEQMPFLEDTAPRRRGGLNRFSTISTKPFRPKPRETHPVFIVKKPAGQRTKCTTTVLSNDGKVVVIAISWKLEGRKVTYKDLLKGVGTDLNFLFNTCSSLKKFADHRRQRLMEPESESQRRQIESLFHNIEIVYQLLKSCDGLRYKMMNQPMDKDDEPILRVHFPDQVHSKQDQPWAKYSQGYSADSWQLVVESERYAVEEEPVWTANVARLKLGESQVSVMPLKEISEEDQEEEIMKGDTVLLLGGLVAVVESPKDGGDEVVNFLKLTALDRVKRKRRRGGNEDGPVPLVKSTLV